jgi:uncharacterized membrane protein YphA (DoxX/SURF4 family)
MSLFFKAHGKSSIGLFLIRLFAGTYMLTLGILQASNVEGYINKVKAMQFLGENLAFIAGFITPFLLIIFGTLYIMGFFTPTTSCLLGLITFVKIIASGIFPGHGMPFNKDIIFLVCFITTFFAGAGIFSFDALLDRKKKVADGPKNVTVTAEVISEPKSEATEEKPSV